MNLLTQILWLCLHTAVSFVASTAFAVIFHSPQKQRYFAGATGAFGWLIYMLLSQLGVDTVPASFFATVGLTLMARAFSFRRKAPVTIFLITGVFPLVPGAGIYSTGYSIFMDNTAEALRTGMSTIEIALVMALGMGLVLSLPQALFTFKRKPKGVGM